MGVEVAEEGEEGTLTSVGLPPCRSVEWVRRRKKEVDPPLEAAAAG